jgi:sugar fermentation stimulation protein A
MLVAHDGVLVSVDARLPNSLFAEALASGRLEPFREYARPERGHVHREVRYGESRLDFRLTGLESVCWVEVKSVTLVENRTALFPDAPTARGTRHIQELSRAVKDGEKAAIVFVAQRPDAQRFAPNDDADPAFGAALRAAADAGVGVYAWTCAVSPHTIALDSQLPVDLR